VDREALAWAAGFWDGEGSSFCRKRQIQAQIGQCEREVLERFADAVILIGGSRQSIRGPYGPYSYSKRPFFIWTISGFERVQALAALLWPWLGTVKRAQFQEALRKWEDRPVLKSYVKTHPKFTRGWHYEIIDGKRKAVTN
jgi:hypothetical protein